ncbi:MAG TPA: hypothetical protein ENF52_06035 [Chloroflexi bacterium]|nr:hypothetical protein [Chloroflexota bacterium]
MRWCWPSVIWGRQAGLAANRAIRRGVMNTTELEHNGNYKDEDVFQISQEEMERVLAQRAAELAALPIKEEDGEQVRLLLMRLGYEIYGIEAQYVLSVRPAESITWVPRVPEWVAGVVNLRGRIFSVLDLRRFFGLPTIEMEAKDDRQPHPDVDQAGPILVVVETANMEVALLVDEVLAVEALLIKRIQSAVSTVQVLRPEYVWGVIPQWVSKINPTGEAHMVIVLDLPVLLADERLIVYEEVV